MINNQEYITTELKKTLEKILKDSYSTGTEESKIKFKKKAEVTFSINN